MRFAGLYIVAAAAVLLTANAWSQDDNAPASKDDGIAAPSDAADKPYTTIVARNIFGLLPIPPPDTNPPAPPVDPPPKITLNGIMTIFGHEQALYKVATKPKPGQPAKDDSYVLGEGERQDDIEVNKIDLPNRTVTFNNHGTIQDLQLTESGSSGGSGGGGSGPGGPPNMRPGAISPADRGALSRGRNLGANSSQSGTRPGYYNPANPPNYSGAGAPVYNAGNATGFGLNGNTSTGSATSANNQNENITPEQQIMLMEAQRAQSLNDGTALHQIIPPTGPMTSKIYQEFGGGGGNPVPDAPPTP